MDPTYFKEYELSNEQETYLVNIMDTCDLMRSDGYGIQLRKWIYEILESNVYYEYDSTWLNDLPDYIKRIS